MKKIIKNKVTNEENNVEKILKSIEGELYVLRHSSRKWQEQKDVLDECLKEIKKIPSLLSELLHEINKKIYHIEENSIKEKELIQIISNGILRDLIVFKKE